MNIVNINETKTQLSQLLLRVQKGEKIIIANQGKPVAFLSPYSQSQGSERIAGRLRGQFTVSDDFYQPDEELINLFIK